MVQVLLLNVTTFQGHHMATLKRNSTWYCFLSLARAKNMESDVNGQQKVLPTHLKTESSIIYN